MCSHVYVGLQSHSNRRSIDIEQTMRVNVQATDLVMRQLTFNLPGQQHKEVILSLDVMWVCWLLTQYDSVIILITL